VARRFAIDWSETDWPVIGAAVAAMACIGVAALAHGGMLALMRPEGWALDGATIALALWAAGRGRRWWPLLLALPGVVPVALMLFLLLACSLSAACL
jgi:hypothetical protein